MADDSVWIGVSIHIDHGSICYFQNGRPSNNLFVCRGGGGGGSFAIYKIVNRHLPKTFFIAFLLRLQARTSFQACFAVLRQCTAWCSEIGSLWSLDAPELHASVTSENQFHCTRLNRFAIFENSVITVFIFLQNTEDNALALQHRHLVDEVTLQDTDESDRAEKHTDLL